MQSAKETTHTHTVSLDSEERAFPDPQWKTGVRARFPWLGFTALFTILLCAISAVVVLLVSDGKSQLHWHEKIAPNVLLSGFNSIANICFGVAIGNGVAITWWRQALKGATIKDLHRSWTFSSSIKDIVSQDLGRNVTVKMYQNNTMPVTGVFGDRSAQVSYLHPWFNQDAEKWYRTNGVFQNSYTRCNGNCIFDIEGTGFEIDCSTQKSPMDYGQAAARDVDYLVHGTINETVNYNLFNIVFEPVYGLTGIDGDYARILMNITSTTATVNDTSEIFSCPGTITQHSCVLRPAIIRYPVTVEDNTMTGAKNPAAVNFVSNLYLGYNSSSFGGQVSSGGSLEYNATRKQQDDFVVMRYEDVLEDRLITGDQSSVIGGIAFALNHYFAGSTDMYFASGMGFVLSQNGSAEGSWNNVANTPLSCDFQYRDPLNEIVQQINSMMFTLAVDPWLMNTENNHYTAGIKNYTAIQYGTSIHYETHKAYMYGAVASIIVCILCVLPSYYGYWQLGRDVTLGPFEIANAFRAPVLDHPSVANAGVKDLIREVGKREVKYGEMVHNEAPGRLAIAEPEAVRRVHPRINGTRW
ncbi:hypothetical protein E4T47_06516 [Aureobasidium subglaciale]|nr:hypothetical protein E4T47_06516 [Aureobasidium subglaciale]